MCARNTSLETKVEMQLPNKMDDQFKRFGSETLNPVLIVRHRHNDSSTVQKHISSLVNKRFLTTCPYFHIIVFAPLFLKHHHKTKFHCKCCPGTAQPLGLQSLKPLPPLVSKIYCKSCIKPPSLIKLRTPF